MIYNYKAEELVQYIITDCICPIIDDIKEIYERLRRDKDIAIYATSDIAGTIVNSILDEIDNAYIDEESDVEALYKDTEVIVSLNGDGGVFIEYARGSHGGLKRSIDCELIYVHDSFKQKDVDDLAASDDPILVFWFAENKDKPKTKIESEAETKPDTKLEKIHVDDKELYSFSIDESYGDSSRSLSYYSSAKITLDEIDDMMKVLGFMRV